MTKQIATQIKNQTINEEESISIIVVFQAVKKGCTRCNFYEEPGKWKIKH